MKHFSTFSDVIQAHFSDVILEVEYSELVIIALTCFKNFNVI